VPAEDRVSSSEGELQDQLVVLLAGRAAEKMVYDETTVGAENDLERATGMARRMVTHWGMSPKLGPVSYKTTDDDPFLGREMHQQKHFSEHTQEMIDGEVSRILNEASGRAFDLLNEKRQNLEDLTKALLKQEELNEREIESLIGPSVRGTVDEMEAKQHADSERMEKAAKSKLESSTEATEGEESSTPDEASKVGDEAVASASPAAEHESSNNT
jgi:cell division protease FtsH